MTPFIDMPIRRKLLSVEMLTVGCALLLACAGFITSDLFLLRTTNVRDLQTLAEITALDSAAALTFADHDAATQLLHAFRVKRTVESARIYDEHGNPFATYLADGNEAFRPPAHLPAKLTVDLTRLEVARPIELDGRRIGTVYIAGNLDSVRAQISSYLKLSAVILMAALIIAFVISFRLQRTISEPIVRLSRVVEIVSRKKDYSIRAPMITGQDEIGNLISGFNAMLGEIQQRDEELSRHRRGLESEVAVRTAQVKRILDTAGEGIFELDADGRATFVNPSAARMLGWPATTLAGTRMHELLHAADAGALEACNVCSSRLPAPLRMKSASFNRREGKPMPVEYTSSTIFGENGTPEGVVVTFRDITERLAVDRMKSEFVSTVSHELRTPLTSIRGALGLLAAGLLGNIEPKARRMLDIAINNTDRLVRLINDILDLERLDSGRVELHRKLIDANELMLQTVDVMQTMADRAEIQLVVEPCHEAIWGDPDRLVQVLTNLVSNAIKFSPSGGIVTLSAVAAYPQFIFRVADQGRGVPADKLGAIFERFKQVDASDSRDKGGTGLGLAICRSIALAHGGRIWAESREGNGSLFQFTIPLQKAATGPVPVVAEPYEESELPHAVSSSCNKPLILIVEDDVDLARIMTTSFETHGIQTMHASNGSDAIDCVTARRPDLIVLDLILPEMDGFAVVDWLKKSTLAHIPLIVYSAMELDAADQARLRFGPTEFLIKSRVSLDEFEEEVVRLLNMVTTETEVEGAA